TAHNSSVQAPPSFRDLTLAQFAERLASPDPVPGGGSASAVAASLAASLVAMVATLSQGRTKYADHAALHDHAIPVGRRYADEFLVLADEDAEAYAACAIALKLPREAFADKEFRVLAEALAGRSNMNASSDLRVAALLLHAAGQGAAENVLVNLPLIGTNEWTQATERHVRELLDDVVCLASKVHDIVSSGERRGPLDAIPEAVAGL